MYTVETAQIGTKDSMGTTAPTKPCAPTVMAHTQLATPTALQPLAGSTDT